MRLMLAAALAAALSPAASAQTQPGEFESYAIAISNPCLQLQLASREAAADAIVKCEKVTADLDLLKAAVPGLAGHDLNVYHIVRGSVFVRLTRANAIVHGVNSQPLCQSIEAAWAHIAKISAADSPSYAAMIRNLNDATLGEVTACRKLFPAPAGAPALPAG